MKRASPWLDNYCAEAYEPPFCNNDDSDLDAFSRVRCIKLPGMGNDAVGIRTFGTSIKVMASKERPKVITVWGEDEKKYKFLVKANDDLRGDRRIEQAFGLVNSMFLRNAECQARKLAVETYTVVPMRLNFGIIEWVDGTTPDVECRGEGVEGSLEGSQGSRRVEHCDAQRCGECML